MVHIIDGPLTCVGVPGPGTGSLTDRIHRKHLGATYLGLVSYLAMHGLNTSSSTEQVGALNIGRIFWYYVFLWTLLLDFINIVSHVSVYLFYLNVQTYRVKELLMTG